MAWGLRHRASVLAAVILASLGAWFGPRMLLGPEVPVTPVVKRDFVKSVVASGHVEAPHRVTIGAQVVGVVQQVPVAEGQAELTTITRRSSGITAIDWPKMPEA